MTQVHISEIVILRDGGTISFALEKDGQVAHVKLDTPMRGEPRRLFINAVSIKANCAEIKTLITDIETWWDSLSPDLQASTLEALAHTGAFSNPAAKMLVPIDYSRVLRVRDYVRQNYLK